MDAQEFLGMQPIDDPLHWRLQVTPAVSTPGNFLFGGCGLGAGVLALETASGRPTVWATAQYLSYAPTGSVLDIEVVLAAVGRHVTQGRAVGRVDGREILTVNAALGAEQVDLDGVWVEPPEVPGPEECPSRRLPDFFNNTILDRIDVRVAKGRRWEDLDGTPATGDSAMWAQIPEHLSPTASILAIFGDYVPGGISQALGRSTLGRSLDNTLRVARIVPTEWVLCDIRMHAVTGGYAHGLAHLWSTDGVLLATASQSLGVRYWIQ